MSERNNEYVYKPPAKFTEELRQRINNAGFSDEFKQQIKSAQKEEGRKMLERLTYWNEEYGCWSYKCASGDAAKHLASYEDSGLSPEEVQELAKAKADGRLVVLDDRLAISMCAGARAIRQNINRMAKSYVYDVYKGWPTIAYLEAARILREAAEKALGVGE